MNLNQILGNKVCCEISGSDPPTVLAKESSMLYLVESVIKGLAVQFFGLLAILMVLAAIYSFSKLRPKMKDLLRFLIRLNVGVLMVISMVGMVCGILALADELHSLSGAECLDVSHLASLTFCLVWLGFCCCLCYTVWAVWAKRLAPALYHSQP